MQCRGHPGCLGQPAGVVVWGLGWAWKRVGKGGAQQTGQALGDSVLDGSEHVGVLINHKLTYSCKLL